MTGVCQKQGHEERYTNGRCAECDRERSRARYAANKQQYKENCKAWRAANPDLYQANNRAYYAATRDAHIASARASYEKDKEGAKERIKLWAQSNPEKRAAIRRRWDELNREQRRASAKATRMADPGKELAKTRKRQAVLAQRLPAWADDAAIRTIYREAARLTKATGVEHHVDHDIPLRGRKVSGLHVHNNLKVVTADVNLKKGNRWEP